MDHTMQAVLRGSARVMKDGVCLPCNVVIFQSNQSGLSAEQYDIMFPGCHVEKDDSLIERKPLTGNAARAAQAVRKAKQRGRLEISNVDIYTLAKVSKQIFADIIKRPAWKAFIDEIGARPQKLPGNVSGLRFVG